MARYIDADELLEILNEELMYESTMFSQKHEEYLKRGIRIAINGVKRCPTADVAPKSEVAIVSVQNAALIEANQNLRKQNTEYKIEIEAMRMAANSYKMHLEDLKTEVARKLLSDLKKAVHDKAVYSYSKEMFPYINLKVFDAVVSDYLKRLEGKNNG